MNEAADPDTLMTERFAKLDVADLILRERLARDNGAWDEMASYYHPSSIVAVSWLVGSGAQFVEMSKKAKREGELNFHLVMPPVVNVHDDRATAETPCVLRNFSHFDGVEAAYEGFVRLFWRARREDGRWLIFGLRALYVTDLLHGRNPNEPPRLDTAELAGFRTSYRYLAATLTNAGIAVRDNLPGIDQPETAATMRAAEKDWLFGTSPEPEGR